MKILHSNVSTYKEIADEAYANMVRYRKDSKVPREDGSGGYVINYNLGQSAFRQSMVVIVFTGMWLEAFLHHHIVKTHDEETFKKYDRKSYRDKLILIGINDNDFLDKVDSFKNTRRELVHEKAHFDKGEIKWAEEEAESAYVIMECINDYFNKG